MPSDCLFSCINCRISYNWYEFYIDFHVTYSCFMYVVFQLCEKTRFWSFNELGRIKQNYSPEFRVFLLMLIKRTVEFLLSRLERPGTFYDQFFGYRWGESASKTSDECNSNNFDCFNWSDDKSSYLRNLEMNPKLPSKERAMTRFDLITRAKNTKRLADRANILQQ